MDNDCVMYKNSLSKNTNPKTARSRYKSWRRADSACIFYECFFFYFGKLQQLYKESYFVHNILVLSQFTTEVGNKCQYCHNICNMSFLLYRCNPAQPRSCLWCPCSPHMPNSHWIAAGELLHSHLPPSSLQERALPGV